MRYSMWAYPWDLQDLGLKTTYDEYHNKAGVNSISLAVSYHAGRFLQPRSPHRKSYFPQDGTIYFTPEQNRWDDQEIKPLVADNLHEKGDMLSALIKDRQKHGLAVSCWTVCLHNTRLGMQHPDHVTRNAFGDPSFYSLCPSSPAARSYVTTLIADLTHNYRPDMVELETTGFMGFDHGYHHEKDGIGLTPEDTFLLSLCFCDHCTQTAARNGVDALSAQKLVKELIESACSRDIPSPIFPNFPEDGIATFKDLPALYDYLKWRSQPVTSLLESIKNAAHPDSKILLIEGENAWRDGFDLKAVGKVCDGMILCAYSANPKMITETVKRTREKLGESNYLGFGASAFYEHTQSSDDLRQRIQAAITAGADGINFYNYGLIPEPRLKWIKASIEDSQA
ncbi:hypothetical protein [Kiloniella antarctica]|uniref:Uncharacterized protein n=1 Tax=Kiloniella antarctica TaxID=1550907 RepID=A0ABW5BPA0_9PROT